MKRFQGFLAHRKRTTGIALSLLMAAGLLGVSGSTVQADSLDLSKEIHVQVSAGSDTQKADLATANLVIDVYQIAKAVKNTDDSYHLEYLTGFDDSILVPKVIQQEGTDPEGKPLPDVTSISEKLIYYPAWEEIANNAASYLFGGETVPAVEPRITVQDPFASGISLPSNDDGTYGGLYLIVPRGNDLENYVKKNDDGSFEGTIAHSETLEYIFTPMLIAAPGKQLTGDESFGTFNTADQNPWLTDLLVSFKVTEEPLNSKFRIVKSIDIFEATDPVTFVFQVEGTLKDQKVLSTTKSISFDGTKFQDEIVIDPVPVGTHVTVQEVYPGANYTLTGSSIVNKEGRTISADEAIVESFDVDESPDKVLTFTFDNTYTGKTNEGGSVINKFDNTKQSDGSNAWVLNKDEREYHQQGAE